MARKNTVWGARHTLEEEEIKRTIEYYENSFNISITKLEASAIVAARSFSFHWSDKKAMDELRKLRGVL